jgi:hypothetical protein
MRLRSALFFVLIVGHAGLREEFERANRHHPPEAMEPKNLFHRAGMKMDRHPLAGALHEYL